MDWAPIFVFIILFIDWLIVQIESDLPIHRLINDNNICFFEHEKTRNEFFKDKKKTIKFDKKHKFALKSDKALSFWKELKSISDNLKIECNFTDALCIFHRNIFYLFALTSYVHIHQHKTISIHNIFPYSISLPRCRLLFILIDWTVLEI